MIQKDFIVTKELTAATMGSGGLAVLATPAVVQMVENTCYEYLQQKLSEQQTTVGTKIELRHVKPSKMGAVIAVEVSLLKQDFKKATFAFSCRDNEKLIATGTHTRVQVNCEKFLSQLD